MHWIEIRIDTTHEAVDWLRMSLSEIGYGGIFHCQAWAPIAANCDPTWAFTVGLYLPQDHQVRHRVDQLIQQLSGLERTGLIAAPEITIVDAPPLEADRLEPPVQKISEKFLVLGPQTPHEPQAPDELVIRLKPTLAFGTGLHPATLLSLQLLARSVHPNMNALDLGSGSGILTVAMAKLGANVLALDNDEIAVQATQDAVALNGVGQQVTVMAGSLGQGNELGHWLGGKASAQGTAIQPGASFDLIMANLFARIHIALAEDYRQALRQGNDRPGILLVAGFTDDRTDDINTALTAVGLEAYDRATLNEWIALAYRLKGF